MLVRRLNKKRKKMKNWKRNSKFFIISAAFATLIVIAFFNVFNMTSVSDKDFGTYQQGLLYLKKNDLQNAYFNFSNISKNSKLHEISLLREAMCADELNDTETAVKKYHLFLERYPDSIFMQKANYALGKNYYKAGETRKAEKIFNNIKKSSLSDENSEYAVAANYYLGLLNKDKNPQKAKVFFNHYLKEAPRGRFALSCVNEIIGMKTDLDAYDYKMIGRTYFLNHFYKNAIVYLNKSDMRTNWHFIFAIYQSEGQKEKAADIFENGYANYSAAVDEEELYKTIEYYAKTREKDEKNGWYKALALSKANHSKGEDFILYRLSKLVDVPLRESFYREIYQKYPQGDFASDAVSNLFWSEYKNRNYNEASKIGRIHYRNYSNTLAAPKVQYWMGKISELEGRGNEARGFYQRILDNYPDDYYAYRADKKLSRYSSAPWKTKTTHRLPSHTGVIHFPLKHTNLSDENIALINLILKLDDFELLSEVEKDNKFVQSWLNYKEKNYSRAAILARDALAKTETKPDFSDSVYKLAYQLHYQSEINYFAQKYGLDPFLVAALIREESYFNPKAKSGAGASGLMQIMPTTASFIAKKEGVPYSSANALLTPEKNIHLGCAYLKYAKDLLSNNDLLAVASYNGGPGAVQSWQTTLDYDNYDEFIESIPYDETRNYVKKVYRTYWIYLNLY